MFSDFLNIFFGMWLVFLFHKRYAIWQDSDSDRTLRLKLANYRVYFWVDYTDSFYWVWFYIILNWITVLFYRTFQPAINMKQCMISQIIIWAYSSYIPYYFCFYFVSGKCIISFSNNDSSCYGPHFFYL